MQRGERVFLPSWKFQPHLHLFLQVRLPQNGKKEGKLGKIPILEGRMGGPPTWEKYMLNLTLVASSSGRPLSGMLLKRKKRRHNDVISEKMSSVWIFCVTETYLSLIKRQSAIHHLPSIVGQH